MAFGFFKKKREEKPGDGIIVLKKPQPQVCGGTYATQDTKAPTEIACDEMTYFDVTSALRCGSYADPKPWYVSAFAVPAGGGTFMFLSRGNGYRRREAEPDEWAFVREDPFPSLVKLVKECDLARDNGFHSRTHGLPENFGGGVTIRYADGEKISFSNNQSPIISDDTAAKIIDLFVKSLGGERIELPRASDIAAIEFAEERQNGGYTRAKLVFNPDGTGTNTKSSRYDDPKVYESVKDVDAETVAKMREDIDRTGLLGWDGLPWNGYEAIGKKTLKFILKDGSERLVEDCRAVPDAIRGGFFNVELEMSTIH